MKNFKLPISSTYKYCEDLDEKPSSQNNILFETAYNEFKLGASINHAGYNIFAIGENGIEKEMHIQKFLEMIPSKHKLYDIIYFYNFKNPNSPLSITLDAGKAVILEKDIDALIDQIKTVINNIVRGKTYENALEKEKSKLESEITKELVKIKSFAKKYDFTIEQSSNKFKIYQKDANDISSASTKKIVDNIEKKIDKLMLKIDKSESIFQEKIKLFIFKSIRSRTSDMMSKIKTKWKQYKDLVEYFDESYNYILNNYTIFLEQHGNKDDEYLKIKEYNKTKIDTLKIKILVDQNKNTYKNKNNIPFTFLENISTKSLFGHVETNYDPNSSTTFFNIHPGYIHLLNGGYIIIPVTEVINNPELWDKLKQYMKTLKVTPENNVLNFNPSPVKVNTKIILIGEPIIYHELWKIDYEIQKLFHITVYFDSNVPFIKENYHIYDSIIKHLKKHHNILNLDNCARKKIIEVGAKISGSQLTITTNAKKIKSILLEANYIARSNKATSITMDHIIRAYSEQFERISYANKIAIKNIENNLIKINKYGSKIGQVNSLALHSVNHAYFGFIKKITAIVYKGNSGVISLDHEVNLSESSHTKGILLLESFLKSRFKKELCFSATLSFEQSYGPVEGDSAICAEYIALVSALSETPMKQNIGITGSMDQHGNVQAIGGINEKIMGFFNIVVSENTKNTYGVIVPKDNVTHLMLETKIRNAIENGIFEIFAVSHIDEAIEIMSGGKTSNVNSEYWEKGGIYHKIEQKWQIKK